MLKTLTICGLAIAMTGTAAAQVTVKPTVRADGTYVPAHVRTAPNATKLDNYSTRPNYNRYTGKVGTVNPYQPPRLPSYRPRRSN